jgi:hypothetical protein
MRTRRRSHDRATDPQTALAQLRRRAAPTGERSAVGSKRSPFNPLTKRTTDDPAELLR